MRSSDVTFKTVDAQVENVRTGEEAVKMDVAEIRYPDGKVVAFPVEEVSPETGQKYKDMFGGKYKAFKSGGADPDRVAQLEREIEEREAELKAMRSSGKDDSRVQENLGYGKKSRSGKASRRTTSRSRTASKTASNNDPGRIDQPVSLGADATTARKTATARKASARKTSARKSAKNKAA